MEDLHPLAPNHLPAFVTEPGRTDVLFVAMGVFVLFFVVGIGVFYFKLHALPEHMAKRGQKIQFEIVCVLALLAMFTHNHAYWIAALLLALVPLPDFTTPLTSMARSLSRIAKGYFEDEPPIFRGPELRDRSSIKPAPTDEATETPSAKVQDAD
ncbi:hypothetical protein H2509_00015 [Stappia sp. F7233]|uniref:Uncharacterized protein n=1 Tax=Stappia albiluteola TaxID=2758565 RepID=A0A839A977_9HYPH|nr:hypothetical protein [Stappia albiluteola]MBA5775507.1 hypothetical protein [Stappia albiluteola]